jgi:hypothetical protein
MNYMGMVHIILKRLSLSALRKNPAIFITTLKEIGDSLQTASSANCQQYPTDV